MREKIAPLKGIRNWSAFDAWHVNVPPPTWESVVPWLGALDRVAQQEMGALLACVKRWDARFGDLEGDPSREDWSEFRPLRLSREEDWSDWLAHLLETSSSGRFASRLFDRVVSAERHRCHSVAREYRAEQYRADLVLRFRDETWTHLEVKVGDLALEKIGATGDALRRVHGGTCRGDVLLLPQEDVTRWRAIEAQLGAKNIQVRTWHDVARALRASLSEAEYEAITWRVWARAFLGAVEQVLLELPHVESAATQLRSGIVGRRIWLMKCEDDDDR